jgi:hypothetical protein
MKSGNRFGLFISCLTLSLVCFLSKVHAQAPFLSATANKTTVGTNEQFQLTYTINANGQRFNGPDLSEFYVHSGPNQSTSMQYVNGNFSQTISLSYILQPKKEGSFKIGPASIEAEGKRIASNVVNLTVVKGTPQQQQAQQNQESGLSNKNIFIKAVINKSTIYQGEAVTVTFRIYTNVSILNYTVNKMPAFNGFYSQEIELPEQLELSNEVIDGVSYRSGEIKKLVLFPQQNGELIIDPMELECIARIQVKSNRRDPFSMFNDPFFSDPFFGGGARDVKYGFKSNSLKIKVLPLPAGAPASFTGTVGNIAYETTLDKTSTKANEPLTLKIKVNGTGNLKLLKAPELNLSADFEVFDPKVIDNIKTNSSGSSGSKTFEYLIIPRNEGNYTIDAVPFSYFDLEKRKYITYPGKSFNVNITKGNGNYASNAGPSSVKQNDVVMMGRDIRYIKLKSDDFSTDSGGFYGSPLFYSLSISPFLLVGGLLFYRKRLAELNSDANKVRTRKATGIAQKRLAAASEALKNNNASIVYEETSRALWGYVSDKLVMDAATLTKESAAAALQNRNISGELIRQWTRLLEDCEFARYAGSAAVSPENIHASAIQLVTDLENQLKA